MLEQLKAVWDSKDKDHPSIRGVLCLETISNQNEESTKLTTNSVSESKLSEKWFTLLGHSLFYCKYSDCQEYSGALLTDLFSPVIARVNQKTLDAFSIPETQQPYVLYLKGILMDVHIMICPQSMEEKRIWLEKFQHAGLSVPTRRQVKDPPRVKDGRDVVIINDALYISPTHRRSSPSSSSSNQWLHQWKMAAQKALSLPDASQIRIKFEFLHKFFESEKRYLNDLTLLVETYYHQLKIAVDSGHVVLGRDQLDAMFLNCESLLMLHKLFCSQLDKTLSQPRVCFGDLLLLFIPHMEIYGEFIRNSDKSIKVLDDCLQISSFTDFLENHHSSHDCEAHQLRMLLHQPVSRLEIYQAFVEKVLEQTSEDHVDYKPLGQALECLQDLKNVLAKASSEGEDKDRILSIIKSIGVRGFLLLEPECKLILEDEMYLPGTSKWVTGTIRRRPVHCYLYSNALVVISMDKKTKQASSRSQVFPLSGATVYEHVTRSGEVTCAKNPDIEIRALKIYSPDGPRNGVIIIFLTQSSKNLWLTKTSEVIKFCTPDPVFPPSPPLTGGPVVTPPPSPAQTHRRRVSLGIIQNGTFSSSSSSNHMGGNKHSPVGGVKSLGMSSSSSSSLSSSSSSMDVKKSPVMISRTHSLFSFDPDGKLLTNNTKPKFDYLSISTLFSLLISSPPNPHYPYTFLLTYRMFTNAHEVLDALLEGHRKELDLRSSPNHKGGNDSVSMESLRFFNILKLWVNKYYVDFHHDVTLKKELVLYLDGVKEHPCVHDREIELAEGLLTIVGKRDHIPLIRRSKLRIQIPKCVEPIPVQLSAISSEALAQQLTWIEHELYSRIKPYEFLQQKWTKKNRLELAPNICHVITRFNQMTEWISKVVLSPELPRQRCTMIVKMIQIAQCALEHNNFVTVFQIIGALSSTAIQRLKKTLDLLPQNARDKFEELKKLASIESGSKFYRKLQNKSPSPSVPYIGPYLSQLVSIEVGMSTFVKDPPEHINFSKLTKLAEVIEEIMRFQNPRYSFKPDGSIMLFIEKELESSSEFDDDQRYSRSIEVEPKKHSNKKLAKVSSTGD